MSEHTPGPWKVLRDPTLNTEGFKGPAGELILRVGWDDRARCPGLADSRLISAAPELLAYAECQKAWDAATAWRDDRPDPDPTFAAHGWDGKEDQTAFLIRIRNAAIARAKP